MIWLYFLIPIMILGGIAIYFEKKSAMAAPDEHKQAAELGQVLNQNGNHPGCNEKLLIIA